MAWLPNTGSVDFSESGGAIYLVRNDNNLTMNSRSSKPCDHGKKTCVISLPHPSVKAPVDGWLLHRLRVMGTLPRSYEVYVSGYKARREKGYFKYWGPNKARSLVTIVTDDATIFRGRVINKLGRVSPIHVPAPSVARR